MKILVVSVAFPAPARSGGDRRLASLLDGLLDRHEVGIVALRREEPDADFAKRFAFVDVVEPRALPRLLPYPLSAVQVWGRTLLGSKPQFAHASRTSAFSRAIERAATRFHPDVAYVEPIDVARAIPILKRRGVPVSFGAIEVVTNKAERATHLAANPRQQLALRRELQRTRRFEERALRDADAIVCVSGEDREAIRSWTGRYAAVAPNGVDAEYFAPRTVTRDPATVVALGPLPYWANLDAVRWFARDVLPLVPGVELNVVGRTGNAQHDLGARVHLAGAVDDVRPYMAEAAALVAPLRIAGGTRLKILEAMAMETPVVTTTIGAEGLDVRDGEQVLIADDAEAFASAVSRVTTDGELRARLGRAGRELVVRAYGWARSVEALEETLARIARPASRAASS